MGWKAAARRAGSNDAALAINARAMMDPARTHGSRAENSGSETE
jgi:hypothetical protein